MTVGGTGGRQRGAEGRERERERGGGEAFYSKASSLFSKTELGWE